MESNYIKIPTNIDKEISEMDMVQSQIEEISLYLDNKIDELRDLTEKYNELYNDIKQLMILNEE